MAQVATEQQFFTHRQERWRKLEGMVGLLTSTKPQEVAASKVTEFTRLHRSACGDLAAATSRRAAPALIQYLHGLVAKGHAQLYCFESARVKEWVRMIWQDCPQQLSRDVCFRIALGTFFGSFLISLHLAYFNRAYAVAILGQPFIDQLEMMHSQSWFGRSGQANVMMSSFYIRHNVTIALQCFALGIFFGLGSVFCLLGNGVILGAAFGHLLAGPYAKNFLSFVLSHAPFELTGIAIAGGAGLKLGFALVQTNGLTRTASLKRAARACAPLICVAAGLILVAAAIEGFWSGLPIPIVFKAAMFLLTGWMVLYYVWGLGRRTTREV